MFEEKCCRVGRRLDYGVLKGHRNVAGVNADYAFFKSRVNGVQRLRNQGTDFERWQPSRAIGVEFVAGLFDFEPPRFLLRGESVPDLHQRVTEKNLRLRSTAQSDTPVPGTDSNKLNGGKPDRSEGGIDDEEFLSTFSNVELGPSCPAVLYKLSSSSTMHNVCTRVLIKTFNY